MDYASKVCTCATLGQAQQYKQRIQASLETAAKTARGGAAGGVTRAAAAALDSFQPLMTLYLTDSTKPSDVRPPPNKASLHTLRSSTSLGSSMCHLDARCVTEHDCFNFIQLLSDANNTYRAKLSNREPASTV